MENLDATRKTEGEKKEAGKIYVLIHICGSEHFLDAFSTLHCTGKSSRNNFQIWKWKKKLHCNGSLRLYPNNSGITCCAVMTSYTTRSSTLSCWLKMYFCTEYVTVVFSEISDSSKCEAEESHDFQFRDDLYSSLSVKVFWITHMLLCKPADPAIVSMTQTSCSDTSADTRGIMTPCLANSVCYCRYTL